MYKKHKYYKTKVNNFIFILLFAISCEDQKKSEPQLAGLKSDSLEIGNKISKGSLINLHYSYNEECNCFTKTTEINIKEEVNIMMGSALYLDNEILDSVSVNLTLTDNLKMIDSTKYLLFFDSIANNYLNIDSDTETKMVKTNFLHYNLKWR